MNYLNLFEKIKMNCFNFLMNFERLYMLEGLFEFVCLYYYLTNDFMVDCKFNV